MHITPDRNSDTPPSFSIRVREMAIDDVAAVYHMGEALFRSDLYPTLYRMWDEWEVIGAYNTDPEFCLVAEANDTLAGFVLGTIVSKNVHTYGYVGWLGVDVQFQRAGVAGMLLDRFIERSIEEGAKFMLVDTDPANRAAVNFFTRKGFGNTRKHVFLSLNLAKHEVYGKLIAYEQSKAERRPYRPRRR